MAFSTNQLQYIEGIVAANGDLLGDEGGYLAWNTVSSTSDDYDLHIVLCSGNIRINSKSFQESYFTNEYLFNLPDNSLRYDIKTSNPSGYNPDLTRRIDISGIPPDSVVSVPVYSTISTNADCTDLGYDTDLFADVVLSEGGIYYAIDQKSNAEGLGVLSFLLVLLCFFIAFFRR